MDQPAPRLQIDPPSACQAIERLIQTTLARLGREGAVIGLSGGLDSAVTAVLTVRCLGPAKVHLLSMPERDSRPLHRKHARYLAEQLGIPLTVKPITRILRSTGTYGLTPLGLVPGRWLRGLLVTRMRSMLFPDSEASLLAGRLQPEAGSWLAKGNAYVVAKHRVRMVVLYQYAEVHGLMVVGAANRTEWLTGTFSKWGVDHCADVMPLLHLYRSQVEKIAEYLQLVDFIRSKPADPDFIPGIHDKGALLGDWATVDQILYAIENHVPREELVQAYGEEIVDHLLRLWELSQQMRESPYSL
jgi:NAD+ synthase